LAGEKRNNMLEGLLALLPSNKAQAVDDIRSEGLLTITNNSDPYSAVKDRIKEHEGFRQNVYLDTLGNETVGVGHKVIKGEKIPTSIEGLLNLYDKDFDKALNNAKSIIDEDSISPEAFGVLVEMNFQMGKKGTLGFKKMLDALKDRNYKLAAEELLDSKFAKQTPNRANTLAEVLMDAETLNN
jgi:lysozyme|tara:strand:- start:9109 stop:9660 length:552 start_codon:yes stop_codon:yes gene_type:complete